MHFVDFNEKSIKVVFNSPILYQEIKNQFYVPTCTFQSDNAH